ncbi:MAG: hypothetical protein ACRD0S_01745 [Acidimicrobiales bacterium]
MTTMCRRCGWLPVYAKGGCRPCYEYQRRTGRPRPPEKILAHLRRTIDQEARRG